MGDGKGEKGRMTKFILNLIAAIGNIMNYRLDVLRGLGPKSLSSIMVIITFLNFT